MIGNVDTLNPGEPATASTSIDPEQNIVYFNFGIPKGDKGDTGDTNLTTFDIVDGELKAYDDKGVIYNLGTVAMEPRGEYDAETEYKKLNTVLYNDSTYMAKEDVVGENPSTSSKWQLIGGGLQKEDIVDNLNSNDATKMLSAKQGKVLNEFIKEKPYYFDTVALMKSSTDLVDGDLVITKGYNSANDGGEALYKITNTQSSTEYQITLDSGLYATLIIEDEVRVANFGAVGNGITDDTDAIQLAMNFAGNKNKPLVFEKLKTYKVDSTRNKIATNGPSTIQYSYGALILRGKSVHIIGNSATLKNTITQEQYDNNDLTVGAVILVDSNEHDESKIGQNNDYNYKHVGQHIIINNLTIDGGSTGINQTEKKWGPGTNNCKYARGISNISQTNSTIELNNVNIQNCLAEGMSGGGSETSIIVHGGTFKNVFPSTTNISGGIEIIDGATIINPMAIEMNPSYPNATQIIRNCNIKSIYEDDNATYCLGAMGLTSSTPADNSNVIVENNVIDFIYNGSSQYKSSIFVFVNVNNLIFKNNVISIKTPNFANVSGYGGIFNWGNISKKVMIGNKIKYTLPSTSFGSFSMPLYFRRSNTTIDEEISERNTFEVTNTLDLSGTNLITFPDMRVVKKEFNYIFHLTAAASSTTLAYRLMYGDNFNQIVVYSPNGQVDLTNFDIQGYGTSAFVSLIGGSANTTIPKQGKIFNLNQFDPNANGESIWIKSSAISDDLTLDVKLNCI